MEDATALHGSDLWRKPWLSHTDDATPFGRMGDATPQTDGDALSRPYGRWRHGSEGRSHGLDGLMMMPRLRHMEPRLGRMEEAKARTDEKKPRLGRMDDAKARDVRSQG